MSAIKDEEELYQSLKNLSIIYIYIEDFFNRIDFMKHQVELCEQQLFVRKIEPKCRYKLLRAK